MNILENLLRILSPWLPVLGWISLIMFVLSLALVPVLLVKIPTNYFVREERSSASTKMTSIHYSLVWLFRNLAGLALVIAGLAMIVLPGQGLLTILLGLFVADFPGKHNLERKIVNLPAVYQSINWIREKRGVEHLARPRQ